MLDQKRTILLERRKAWPEEAQFNMPDEIAISTFKALLPAPEECLKAVELLKKLYDGKDYLGPA
jgi:hypothetical protein